MVEGNRDFRHPVAEPNLGAEDPVEFRVTT